ncbi:MarR family winged helix-turn-helix transcriptional regulator [Pseudomonas sp. PSKL.D1]|uniref:MarR family winged helix-turn-helix transcriptional regulator n=1 Tax=Pseudomonas sp. PSKL.D1 TaxID=3029060 RepID=UPI002380D05E|nr:MarR family transcriptional regulator [Pseudomonas sp. PSKL.D1]WDY55765.1 MarR family transcriptional regulator [Pseudomonas sp. PSKL.D1]
MPRKPKESVAQPMQEPLDSLLNNLVGYVMRRAQMKITQHLTNRLEEHDIRPAQFTALSIIEQSPGLMQADLAKALAIEPPQTVLMINKLESRGLAMRVRSNPDKRSYGLFLSKAGEQLLAQLKDLAAQSDLESTAALSDSEREQLLTLLHKLYRD